MRKSLFLVMAALLTVSASSSAAELGLGDKAPKLEVKEFVKGDPVKELAKGKIYVVEFWATWCGPCRATIPHLTELQKKHKDVVFIGVSVWERNAKAVVPFVKEIGEKMDYRVATDSVPDDGDANEGKMAKNWMEAAGQGGIPTAFIVDKEGIVAWIGHPGYIDKPLDEIVGGRYNLKVAIEEYKKKQEAEAAERKREAVMQVKFKALKEKLNEAQQSGDPKKILTVLENTIKEDSEMEPYIGLGKFNLMRKIDGGKGAAEYGKTLVEKVFKDNANQLNNVAWMLVDPQSPTADAKLQDLALAAAERANKLEEGKNAGILDTLARAYFVKNQPAKALEIQEKAIQTAKGTPLEDDKDMAERLKEYKKAVAK